MDVASASEVTSGLGRQKEPVGTDSPEAGVFAQERLDNVDCQLQIPTPHLLAIGRGKSELLRTNEKARLETMGIKGNCKKASTHIQLIFPPRKEMGDLDTMDKEKTEVLNDIYSPIFNGKCSGHAAQVEKGK
ncbi:hypothetical protein BTVI_19660 [Pitangus sulphuratus]|nr:hypothetical protein BTVI_19660 [Pitangus sulphuratus]